MWRALRPCASSPLRSKTDLTDRLAACAWSEWPRRPWRDRCRARRRARALAPPLALGQRCRLADLMPAASGTSAGASRSIAGNCTSRSCSPVSTDSRMRTKRNCSTISEGRFRAPPNVLRTVGLRGRRFRDASAESYSGRRGWATSYAAGSWPSQ